MKSIGWLFLLMITFTLAAIAVMFAIKWLVLIASILSGLALIQEVRA